MQLKKERLGLNEEYLLSRYLGAAELLPRHLKEKTYRLSKKERLAAEELRRRAVSGLSVLCAGEEIPLDSGRIGVSELSDIVCAASNSSLHTVTANIREGFVTAENGHRIGICGTAAVKEGAIVGIQPYSSLNIRISKEIRTAAEGLPELLTENGRVLSALIVSPPGGGKTTLLRDLVRRISDSGIRTAVADERGELAAMKNGVPQLDVGRCSDVMDMAPRAQAALFLIRAMNPQVLAMDEISSQREREAVLAAAGCGTAIFATAHGLSAEEALASPRYRPLFEEGVFDCAVGIEGSGLNRCFRVVKREGL